MNRAFSVAFVDESETTFNESHVREDLFVLDLTISQAEGDFAALALEVENPRVGLLAPGRPRWMWVAWNPNYDPFASESSAAEFADMVPLFFGRVQGVPADFIAETVTLNFLARPLDYEAQKAALADTLREAPWFDGVWFGPDNRFEPDNVLESRAALWHIDRVSHEVTTSNIITGEGGTVTFTGDDVLADSIRISYGDPPCRQVNVTATVAWDQIASGQVPIFDRVIDTYTGGGLVANWPKPGAKIGGDWAVAGSGATRIDGTGNDVWTYTNAIGVFGLARKGFAKVMPPWATEQTVLNHTFPAHVFVLKKWKVSGQVAVGFDTKRGRSEVVQFALRSNTQSILTDSTDGETKELTFTTSEVAAPVGTFSDGSFDFPLGKLTARSYVTTDRGAQSIEYLILVARAHLLASARCVDVTFEVPWSRAIEEGINCRKNVVVSDSTLPGGVVGGKVKNYTLRANGDSGVFTCEITIGCTIGKGGTVTAVDGTPTYVDGVFDTGVCQVHEGAYAMPVPGEVAYKSIAGADIEDDGVDFERMTPGRILLAGPTVTNQAPDQEAYVNSLYTFKQDGFSLVPDGGPKEPQEMYDAVNTLPTTISFQLKPLNSGPFANSFFIDTTLLSVPKTIDLEADMDSSS